MIWFVIILTVSSVSTATYVCYRFYLNFRDKKRDSSESIFEISSYINGFSQDSATLEMFQDNFTQSTKKKSTKKLDTSWWREREKYQSLWAVNSGKTRDITSDIKNLTSRS